MNKVIQSLKNIEFADNNRFFLIAGPCVVENKEICFTIAETLIKVSRKYKIPYIFKASYKKANRSRVDSFTGIGDRKALNILADIRKILNIPVITDIHSAEEALFAAPYVDILQIPAFLCRQTDLLMAAGKTKKVVNIKKGQFLSPEAMQFAIQKVEQTGNTSIMVTERGTTFGYQDLVVDFRGIPIMKRFGYPVVLDITHSLQQPNQAKGVSGGLPELIETIAKAGIAVGVDGIFLETHPQPEKAKSDGTNMLALDKVELLIQKLTKIFSSLE